MCCKDQERSSRADGKVGIKGMWIVLARSPMVRVSIGRGVVIAVESWVDLEGGDLSNHSRVATDGGIGG